MCLEMFWTVLACKWCLICAYFSPDSDEMTFSYFRWKLKVVKVFMIHLLQTCSFSLQKMLTNELESCGLLVDYCNVVISCLDSHSDGTHSLQRTHW